MSRMVCALVLPPGLVDATLARATYSLHGLQRPAWCRSLAVGQLWWVRQEHAWRGSCSAGDGYFAVRWRGPAVDGLPVTMALAYIEARVLLMLERYVPAVASPRPSLTLTEWPPSPNPRRQGGTHGRHQVQVDATARATLPCAPRASETGVAGAPRAGSSAEGTAGPTSSAGSPRVGATYPGDPGRPRLP